MKKGGSAWLPPLSCLPVAYSAAVTGVFLTEELGVSPAFGHAPSPATAQSGGGVLILHHRDVRASLVSLGGVRVPLLLISRLRLRTSSHGAGGVTNGHAWWPCKYLGCWRPHLMAFDTVHGLSIGPLRMQNPPVRASSCLSPGLSNV